MRISELNANKTLQLNREMFLFHKCFMKTGKKSEYSVNQIFTLRLLIEKPISNVNQSEHIYKIWINKWKQYVWALQWAWYTPILWAFLWPLTWQHVSVINIHCKRTFNQFSYTNGVHVVNKCSIIWAKKPVVLAEKSITFCTTALKCPSWKGTLQN